MTSIVKRHVNSFHFFESQKEFEIASESSNKSSVKDSHRRDTKARLQKLFVSLDLKNIIQETQKNLMNTLDDVIDDYNELQKQINTMKFKINNELVIKNDVTALDRVLSTSIKSSVKTSINASISVAMTKFQNNVNSINSTSKFVKSNQKTSASIAHVSQQNQISSSAIQSFDQQDARNTQYQSSTFEQKTHERRSFDTDDLHQNRERSSLVSSDQQFYENSFLHSQLQRVNDYNEIYEERQSRFFRRDNHIHQHSQSRSRSRHASLSSSKSDELRGLMLIKQNQFKLTDIDIFHFWYTENKNFIDYVINEKKVIYTSVQLFVQTVRQYVINNESVLKYLYLCLRDAAQIWWAGQNLTKQLAYLVTIDTFCNVLVTRYEKHSTNVLRRMQVESFIVKDAQKRRQFDEYVSIFMRYAVSLNMSELIVFTMTWIALDKKFRKHVRRLDKRTTTKNFIRDLKNAIEYYASDINKKNAIEIAYQREVKSKQIQNSERFDRYSESYSEDYSTNYSFRSQDAQPSRNWQTFLRNSYTSSSSQNRSQYSLQNQTLATQNQISATQNLSPSQRISQYFTRTTQYFMLSSAQKLLTNNASYNAFISTFYEQYDYNADSEYDEKQIQAINENIKFETLEHANFDDIIIFFHAETSELEIFNDEIYTRHDMSFMSCNICKQSYLNNDDRARLDNHMMIIHEVNIKFSQFMNQKRYINWMKHAVLHVVTIRDFSSEREYVIMQARLYIEDNDEISVCIDTESSVSFIDESLLSADNLWNRLHNCHSITIRDIASERIVDKQMNISLFVIVTDDSMKRIDCKVYVSKKIKVEIILSMNELDKIEDDIAIWLDRKKMQLNNCHVIINFTSRESQSVIFFADSTSRNHYTDRQFCFKSFDDRKSIKKTVRFAEITIESSYKLIRFSDILSQIKSCKIENFKSVYDSNIAKLKSFANARSFVFNFANIFTLFLHSRAESANLNWRARSNISNRRKSFTMIFTQRVVVAILTIFEDNSSLDEDRDLFSYF